MRLSILIDHFKSLIDTLYNKYPHILHYQSLKEKKESNKRKKEEEKEAKKEENLLKKKSALKKLMEENIRPKINFIQGRDEIEIPKRNTMYSLEATIASIKKLNILEKGKY